ncbi:MAG: ribonucrease [Solirubrobacteraceae bacterium]|jgi:ribonuclease Y|nr:ribonucrease [Solirubrobacteraceae bacterium]
MDIGVAAVILVGAALVGAGVVAAVAILVRRIEASGGQSEATVSTARLEEVARSEERLRSREDQLDATLTSLAEREAALKEREAAVEALREERLRALESVAGLGVAQARAVLLKDLEDNLRHDQARLIRQVEHETKRDADRRVRNILAVVTQRMAASHATETTVSVVPLSGDDMKGRIIGREGRNIRALEHLTGIDFIIDDTPNAVVLSGFDGVRREVARLTLEKLLLDGRIHPARIEETFFQARSELEEHIVKIGEEAAFEAGVPGLDVELVRILGRLRYRTSYGQNVLAHSVECAHLAAMMADELGASAKTARRAALLHDIGKAVSHEVEGPHALVGGQLARKWGESESVAHAMEAHHNEVEPQTVEAVLVQAADALSGARPGARGESLEAYVKRLRELEDLATRHDGVDKVYAMQAGREIRVMVRPGALDDDGATLLSHEIAREIEQHLEYPGQIKVTVIRESRATDYAR